MEAGCVSTFPRCDVFILYKERTKICKLQTSAATHSRPFKTQKWYYATNWQEDWSDNPVESTIFCSAHEICHSLAIFSLQIWIKMSYSGCSRLCEALIMDWRLYFCPLLSVMTAVSELNIKLNSCQGDKCLEWFLFHRNNHLFLFLFPRKLWLIYLHFSLYIFGNVLKAKIREKKLQLYWNIIIIHLVLDFLSFI